MPKAWLKDEKKEEKDLLEEVEYKWNLYDENTDARVMFLKNLSSYIKKSGWRAV